VAIKCKCVWFLDATVVTAVLHRLAAADVAIVHCRQAYSSRASDDDR